MAHVPFSKYDLKLIKDPPFNISRQDTISMLNGYSVAELFKFRREWNAMPALNDQGDIDELDELESKSTLISHIMNRGWVYLRQLQHIATY
jgi:hypothetical protein